VNIMLRPRGVGRVVSFDRIGGSFLGVLFLIGVAAVALLLGHDRVDSLTAVLGIAAVAAGFGIAGDEPGTVGVSAAFIVIALAAAFLGPASAGAAGLVSEVFAAVTLRTSLRSVLSTNLPASVLPAVGEGFLVHALAWPPLDRPIFYVAVSAAATAGLLANFALYVFFRGLDNPAAPKVGLSPLIDLLPTHILSLALALAGVAITLEIGQAGIAFALAAVLAFSYMVHLLRESRDRAEQYASLSWGVLAGLMRTLDIRDERTARHSAAVARFARDIAAELGMSETEQELAHTAGLLHDIGRFALSDRVAERGRTLAEEDWAAIQRHPELGADMLRDLGMYGPVAEIVRAHHERIDGRGYPMGLAESEIPEIAKIISVAEVYDTLTASDTYRTQMSSFEALTELRRVAGSQLDARYIEVLAGLLTGEGVEYRHADTANFDRELNMERRMREAASGR
jgi:putative nucleotidyltransferase with HDIG domain